MKNNTGLLAALLFLCSVEARPQGTQAIKTVPAAVMHNSTSRSITALDYSLNAVLWQQRSGEYKALCYQAFALAKMRLTEKITAHKKDEVPLAIITDIDETVLDNSPQQADDILHRTTYTEQRWKEWTGRAEAGALPGAVAFFNGRIKWVCNVFT